MKIILIVIFLIFFVTSAEGLQAKNCNSRLDIETIKVKEEVTYRQLVFKLLDSKKSDLEYSINHYSTFNYLADDDLRSIVVEQSKDQVFEGAKCMLEHFKPSFKIYSYKAESELGSEAGYILVDNGKFVARFATYLVLI